MHIVGTQRNVSYFLTVKHKDAIMMADNTEIQICYTPFQASPDQQKKIHTVNETWPHL